MKATIKTNDLMAAMTAISKDQSQPILTGVHIEVLAGVVTVVATDSYRLIATESTGGEEDGEVTIDLSGVKLKKNEALLIEATEDSASLTVMSGVKYEPRVIEGKFPNWRQLLPYPRMAVAQTHMGMNPSYANDMGKAYRLWSGNNKAPVVFEFAGSNKPMFMITESEERSFIGLVMPVKIDESILHFKQPIGTPAPKAESDLEKRVEELEADNAELRKHIDGYLAKIKTLKAELDEASKVKASEAALKEHIKEHVVVADATSKKIKAKKQKAPKVESSLQDKVDALIAEFETVKVAGTTSCAVYFEPTIKKDSPEYEAVKAAGARYGNHRKYGKCWYMPNR